MLKRILESSGRNFNIRALNTFGGVKALRGFATVNVEGLKKILREEITHEEQNYAPVDASEMKTFFNNTKFSLVDQPNSINLELRKSHGNFDVVVNFQAKPPIPQEENPQQEGEEKSKLKFLKFN